MRVNENKVTIEGYLYALDDGNGKDSLTLKQSGPNSKKPGTNYIAGTMLVAVDEEGLNLVPVHFTYVTENYSSGKSNRNYGILAKLIDEDNTWVSVGKEYATKVRVDASIGLNEFYGQDGNFVAAKRNEGSFISIVNGQLAPAPERARFATDMVITKVDVIEANDERNIPEHAILRGCIFDFRNAILPIEYVVRTAPGIKYFDSLDASSSNPIYTRVTGRINCSSVTYEERTESAFGDPIVTTRTRRTREWEVTNSAKEPYEFGEEGVLTVAELTAAMQNREVHVADIKRRADEYAASKAAPTASVTPTVKKGEFKF